MSNFLGCGNLASGFGCTVGDYVLEWRLGSRTGEVVFKSGKGTDVQIQAQHPFYNEIVQAGTLYPVLQYIYLNGEKYTSDYEDGSFYSPDLIDCFDPVVIDPVSCSTILGSDVDYNFYLAYNNTTDTADDKSRTLTYVISETTQYFAWKFQAYDVAEQLCIYYCTAEDSDGVLLDNFICGTRNASGGGLVQNLDPVDYPTNPRIYNYQDYSTSQALYYITNLTSFTYQEGDYLKIIITGSVLEPSNTNTNWYLGLQCLDAVDETWYSSDLYKIEPSSESLAYVGDPNCYYQLSYDTLEYTASTISKVNHVHDLYRYMHCFYETFGLGFQYMAINPVSANILRWKNTGTSFWMWNGASHYGCTDLGSDTISIAKDGSDFSFSFSSQDGYDRFVSNISSIQADADYITWQGITDVMDVRYYARYQVAYSIANSCGDTVTKLVFYFWLGCSITYDAVNKIVTFGMTVPSNPFTDTECDGTYDLIVGWLSTLSNTYNYSIPPEYAHSHIMSPDPVAAISPTITVTNDTSRECYSRFFIRQQLLNGVIDPATLGFKYDSSAKKYYFYRYYDRLSFLNYSTHEERMSCWRFERMAFLRTEDYADNYYEIVAEGSCTTTTTTTIP